MSDSNFKNASELFTETVLWANKNLKDENRFLVKNWLISTYYVLYSLSNDSVKVGLSLIRQDYKVWGTTCKVSFEEYKKCQIDQSI